MGQVITFYSYKGGTGRTMALVNTAVLLARRRTGPVLVMDWDLEAPGLHRFFPGANVDADTPGTIDLVEDLAGRAGSSRGQPLEEEETLALVRKVDLDRYISGTNFESLRLIRAGAAEDESDYARRVNGFDWANLYRRAPYLFTALSRVLAERFRYVLVDSRTGLTDTSGICTAVLPEKLVIVFTPNRQSLEGALWRTRAAVAYRRRADDPRPLAVYPLASRVELSEDDLRREWRHGRRENGHSGYQPAFEQLLKDVYGLRECDLTVWFDEVQLQQSTRYAYGESIAVTDDAATADRLSLARSYETFAKAMDEAESPWTLERPVARRDPEDDRARVVLKRVEREVEWHSLRARRRSLFLMLRLYQALAVLAGVVAAVWLEVSYSPVVSPGLVVAAGVVVAALLEVAGSAGGLTHWRTHAKLADALNEELYRYRSGTGAYAGAEDPAAILGDRADDALSSAYERWPESPLGLAPSPRPPAGFTTTTRPDAE